MVCGYAYHIWCNITHSTQNGKQVSNSKGLNQPTIIHLGCWVDGMDSRLVGRGITKDVNAWMPEWFYQFHCWQVLFHYKLLSLIASSTRGVEHNSYNTISWAITEIYRSPSGAACPWESRIYFCHSSPKCVITYKYIKCWITKITWAWNY